MFRNFFIHFILFPIYISPRIFKIGVAYGFTLLWYYVLPHRKQLILNNIKLCFPDYTKKQVHDLAFSSFWNWALTSLEYSYFPYIKKKRLHQIVKFEGEENLKQAFEQKKGVLVLGTHTGNGELAIYRMCVDGYPFSLIGRNVKNRFINDALFSIREKSGLKHLNPKNSSLKVVRALKRNEGLLFVIDQFTYPPIGIKTNFFGQVTGTNSSLAYFSLKLGSPVIPAFSYRKKGQIIVVFGKEIKAESPYQDLDKNISFLTQRYNDWIEQTIRKYPKAWMWIHKRWKKYF